MEYKPVDIDKKWQEYWENQGTFTAPDDFKKEKFYSLIDTKSLYLCRADLLQERFEGTYSREQILDLENLY